MKKISSRNYLAGLRIHFLPIVVWLGTVALVVTLFSHRSRRYEILGVAQGPIHQIAATCDGRIATLAVGLFDEVKEGQLLVVLDAVRDSKHPQVKYDATMETLVAQADYLAAESELARMTYAAQVTSREAQLSSAARPFSTNVNNAKLLVIQLKASIKSDEYASERLDIDINRFVLEGRLDANDLAYLDLRKMENQKSEVGERIKGNLAHLEQAEVNLAEAEKREAEFTRDFQTDPAATEQAAEAVLAKRTKVLSQQMNEVLVRIEALKEKEAVELRAPFDGVVNMVQHSAGEVVLMGEPILTIARKEPENIVAYATEEQAARVQPQMTVQLIDRKMARTLVVDSRVLYVGPTVEQMPPRLWRNPNRPQWGRPILIEIPSNLKLVPGAVVGIKGL